MTTIYWGQKLIFVSRSELTLVQSSPTEIRELDLNVFRLELKDLEDSEAGMSYLSTHNHVAPITVGGVTLARVVEIINDYTITFEDGQYAVNIVGGNSNVGDKTNVNQVSVRSANSAGLVQSGEIEYASYQQGVTIDVINGIAGTSYPIGTRQSPVNNLTDALFIAGLRGFDTIYVIGDLDITAGNSVSEFVFRGQSPSKTTITLADLATVYNCEFNGATVTGTLDGNSTLNECTLSNLEYVTGHVHECILGPGAISLAPGASPVVFLDCWASADATPPTIDLGGVSGPEFALRNFSGSAILTNKGGGGDVVIDLESGSLILDASLTGGSIEIRGIGSVVDNSTGATINSTDLLGGAQLAALPDYMLDLPGGVETNLTMRQALRLFAAVLLGKVSGAGTGTEKFRDTNDTKDRVTSTVDAEGNRTAVTKDPS